MQGVFVELLHSFREQVTIAHAEALRLGRKKLAERLGQGCPTEAHHIGFGTPSPRTRSIAERRYRWSSRAWATRVWRPRRSIFTPDLVMGQGGTSKFSVAATPNTPHSNYGAP